MQTVLDGFNTTGMWSSV